MAQPALRQNDIPDEVMRLAEELNAASSFGYRLAAANTDQTASSLARRFAPDSVRQRASAADPTRLAPVEPSSNRPDTKPRRFVRTAAIGLASVAALAGGMMWLGGLGDLDLDRAFHDAGLVTQTDSAPRTSAALSIDVLPPRFSDPALAPDGDGKVRTAARPDVAPPLSSGFAVRAGESDRVEGLMAHGQKMIDVGYLAGARAYYRRAAEAGSGEAAIAVGATYDPKIIARLGVQGIKPDRTEAAKWYARAAGLGIADRETTLQALTEHWGQEPPTPKQTEVMAAASPALVVSAPIKNPLVGTRKPQVADDVAERQRLASNSAARASSVRPQLLASEEEPKPGPLTMLMRAATGQSAQEEWMEVASPVNIRKGPSSTAGTDKVAPRGAKFRVVGREGNWIRVADPKTAKEGYIYNRFLKESSAP
ncbi:SH3 domain-containing protein [Methyloceanibacter sp. wino2]|uniref:SH3 domain-containing protein n=1 Tax=Methyloceanibacter sp. wino2 TaxID=2170729 RepID=UPI00131ED271|nr:SH3 domain-containing protein [Methyloceanibacter sp. wino2]